MQQSGYIAGGGDKSIADGDLAILNFEPNS
jgi:hypothetical protein